MISKKVFLAFVLAVVAAGTSPAAMVSVLQTGDLNLLVDSIEVRGALTVEMVATPGFGGQPNTEDTFRFGSRVPWPDRGARIFYTVDGMRRDPLDLPDVAENEWYQLPMLEPDGPAQIKFYRAGSVLEGHRPVQPVRVSVAPNPLRSCAAVRLAVFRSGPLRVEVFDGTGQIVRILAEGRAEPGQLALLWDGSDSTGARVATGVYFVRAVLGESRSLAKVVVAE